MDAFAEYGVIGNDDGSAAPDIVVSFLYRIYSLYTLGNARTNDRFVADLFCKSTIDRPIPPPNIDSHFPLKIPRQERFDSVLKMLEESGEL